MRIYFALIGIALFALVGWLIGALLEHPPGQGGFQAVLALVGVAVAVGVLALGEALKAKE